MAAKAGVEPTTLRLRVIALTNAPPCPTMRHHVPQMRHHVPFNVFLLTFVPSVAQCRSWQHVRRGLSPLSLGTIWILCGERLLRLWVHQLSLSTLVVTGLGVTLSSSILKRCYRGLHNE